MKKRIISMILVLATLVGMLPTAAFATNDAAAPHPFTDVKEQDWYDEYVTYVWTHGLFNGVSGTRFAPGDKLTRGMFVTVLGRMAGIDSDRYTDPVFDDVDPNAWYGPGVAWAAENRITIGTADGQFSPGAYATREQIALFVLRYLELIGHDLGDSKALTYADKDEISECTQEAVAVCSALGLFIGDTNHCFRPKDSANRAEGAAIFTRLHRMLNPDEEPEVHTVQFVLNYEGAPEIAAQQVTDGECAVQPESVVRDGYVFGYWYFRDGDSIYMFDLSQPVTKDLTLYAYWIEEGSGSTVNLTTFYKVSFGYPADLTEEETYSLYLPEEQLVCEGSLVYVLPEPTRDGYAFGAWCYDSALTQLAGAEDVITGDVTLYPLMVEDDSMTDGMVTNNYVADLDVTDLNHSVTVKAPSYQAVKDDLVWVDISSGSVVMDTIITDNGDGTYTIRTAEDLVGGRTYQLQVLDREKFPATGVLVNAADSYIRYYHNGELQSPMSLS